MTDEQYLFDHIDFLRGRKSADYSGCSFSYSKQTVRSWGFNVLSCVLATDRATFNHCLRVGSELAVFAELLLAEDPSRLTPNDVETLVAAGLMHDIGKVDPIIGRLIQEPRRLTQAEMTLVNMHAEESFKWIQSNPFRGMWAGSEAPILPEDITNDVAHVVLPHHHNGAYDDEAVVHLEPFGVDLGKLESASRHRMLSSLLKIADRFDALDPKNAHERPYIGDRLKHENIKVPPDHATIGKIILDSVDCKPSDLELYMEHRRQVEARGTQSSPLQKLQLQLH